MATAKKKASKSKAKKTPAKAKAKTAPVKKVKAVAKTKSTKKAPAKAKIAKKSAPKTAAKKTAKPVKKPAMSMSKKSSTLLKTPASPKKSRGSLQAWENLFTPLEDRIIVRIETAPERTAGGLYLPSSVSEQPQQGLVLSVGRGRKDKKGRLRPMDVQQGETVVFAPYSGSKMNVGEEEVLILREEEVLGVLIS